MGDDGAGPAVVEAMRPLAGERANLFDAGLAFGEVLCDLDPACPLVVIDAVRGGGPPGRIYRLTPDHLGPVAAMPSAVSLHEVNVLPALGMEALAGRRFDDVTIFGVEPEHVAWGEGLSELVADAVRELVVTLCRYLDDRAVAAVSGGARTACGSEN